ncbi:8675_t:CDS:10 [Ambispora leptoticha]|uniref:8675_t:CDS:1 n=1 Tax=Ambispora leptoticha TaxID=144679 RepID=A0A9N8V4F5_9GLOM|nr:8675_t:CDS:10 [Ambispora leptoticha]
MNVEEITKLKNEFNKAISGGREPVAIDILKKLKAEVNATKDLLKKTEIGVCVNKQKTHTNPNIANLAKDIVKKWRTDVQNDEKVKKNKTHEVRQANGAPANAKQSVTNNKQTSNGYSKPVQSHKVQRSNSQSSTAPTPATSLPNTPYSDGGGGERNFNSDGVKIDSSIDKKRSKMIEILYNALVFDSLVDSSIILSKATEIEEQVYRQFNNTDKEYREKLRGLIFNLKDRSNPRLRCNVVDGELAVQRLCTMSKQEMASEERKAKDAKIREQLLFKARGAGQQEAETDAFRCGKCGQRKTTYYQMQAPLCGQRKEDLRESKKVLEIISTIYKEPYIEIHAKNRMFGSAFVHNSNLSYVQGRTDTSFIGETIGDFLDSIISKYGDRQALVVKHENNLHWSYRQFGEQIDALARGLYRSGLRKGDRMCVFMFNNNSAWATIQYATAKIGVILVAINPSYQLSEIRQILNDVRCKSLLLSSDPKSARYIELIKDLIPELSACQPNELIAEALPELRQVIVVDTHHPIKDFENFRGIIRFHEMFERSVLANDVLTDVKKTLSNKDIITIQFTSGSTGDPKGVSLSHRNVLNNAKSIGHIMGLTPDDVLCSPFPVYHCSGFVLSNLATLSYGASVVYPNGDFNAEKILRAIEEEKCTALHGAPTMFIEEMNHPNFHRFDLSSLRTGVIGSVPVPVEVMKAILDKMHLKDLVIGYGMTETSPVSFATSPTDSLQRRVETVGTILPHIQAKIIDPATNQILPVNKTGELCVNGYCIMEGGYWNDEERTKKTMSIDENGIKWLHTGDIGKIDQDGYCTIFGRIKDQIYCGSEEISPSEVENIIFQHPSVKLVSVIGVPDMVFGEEICAWVIPKHGEIVSAEEIRRFCEDKLPEYKIPKYVMFTEKFSKTTTGKITKCALREQARKILQT